MPDPTRLGLALRRRLLRWTLKHESCPECRYVIDTNHDLMRRQDGWYLACPHAGIAVRVYS